jgi:ribosomal protein S18 acetylase RimI-like enzyme
MDLRPATMTDVPDIARVHLDSWRATYRGIVSEAFMQTRTYERTEERWREFLATTSGKTYLVELSNKTVGILTLGDARDTDVDATRTGEIWSIYLSPKHWRKGIGRQVMAEAESILGAAGYGVVVVWVLEANERARRFYEAMGFAPDGASHDIDLGEPVKAIRYTKAL